MRRGYGPRYRCDCGRADGGRAGRREHRLLHRPPYRPSRPEDALLVILETTSGPGWLLWTIAHARNDVPLRSGSGVMSLGGSSGELSGSWSLRFSDVTFLTGKAGTAP